MRRGRRRRRRRRRRPTTTTPDWRRRWRVDVERRMGRQVRRDVNRVGPKVTGNKLSRFGRTVKYVIYGLRLKET